MNRPLVAVSLVLVSLGSLVLACGAAPPSDTPAVAPSAAPAPAAPADAHVDGTKAKALVAAGARLVDVRTPTEFGQKHIDGAVNLPVDTIGDHEADLGAKDTSLVLYCGSGARAARAATTLRAKGYTKVYELGAMSNWDK
jgi:rhodanese-related sulfurtransferase